MQASLTAGERGSLSAGHKPGGSERMACGSMGNFALYAAGAGTGDQISGHSDPK